MVWNLFPFKVSFSFGKSQKSTGCQIWAAGDWVTWVIWCFAKQLCRRCDARAGPLPWWSCPSPVAHSCSLLNYLNSFHRGMFKLNAKFDADSLLFLFSHFECDGHTAHMLTQWCLLPPLTGTVKSSLFTHVHSRPFPLAARLHWRHVNHSHYINNGWSFPRQTSYVFICKSIQKDLEGYKPGKSCYLWEVNWVWDGGQGNFAFYCLHFNYYKTSLMYYLCILKQINEKEINN